MKRLLSFLVLALALCWLLPCETQACSHLGHRVKTVVRAPLRVARAPVRLVRTIRQRRCGCGAACYCAPAGVSAEATACEGGACPAQ